VTAQPIIQVENLSKVYRTSVRREGIGGAFIDLFARRRREIRAVDDISFQIGRGEVVGYIGANGAGKSTTIKMLTGILTPTSGRILINGLVPERNRQAHAQQIGVVFGQRTQLWWDLAVIEAFHLLQKIYRVPEEQYRQRLAKFVEVLDIEEQLHQPVRKLSLGQRMKCDLCASLLHNPPLLFLDEPTIGLDVAVKERIRRFIRYINETEGSTIILTTHDLTDIEELCPRIIIIDAGKIIFDGLTTEIKERYGRQRRVIVDFKQDYLPAHAELPAPDIALPISSAAASDQRVQGVNGNELPAADEPGARQFMAELSLLMGERAPMKVKRLAPRQYRISFDRSLYSASDVVGQLLSRYSIDDLALHEPDLGDVVREIYEGRNVDFSVAALPPGRRQK
jgi:ABC-2 type transport system ATP-binding protein